MEHKNELISLLFSQSNEIFERINKERITSFLDDLFDFLFLIDEKKCISFEDISFYYQKLKLEFENILIQFLEEKSTEKVKKIAFFEQILPEIYKNLQKDALFFKESDPAATSVREIQVVYPGFYAIAVYRIAHQLKKQQINLLPRLLTEYAHSKTGIDIHPSAEIGVPFMIDHGTGTVIGETCHIGNFVKIFQSVTLGALSVSVEKANTKRHPTIGNNVVIYAGATILGGETIIGDNAVIGGNVWLTQSVEPNSKVFHKSQIIVKDAQIKEEPINFII